MILDCLEYGAGSCRNEDMIEDLIARAEAAEAEAAGGRAERARYGDIMTTKLAAAEAEIERLREQVALMAAAYESQTLNLKNAADRVREAQRDAKGLREEAAEIVALVRKINCPICGRSVRPTAFAVGDLMPIHKRRGGRGKCPGSARTKGEAETIASRDIAKKLDQWRGGDKERR